MPTAPRQPTQQVIAYMGRVLRWNDFGLAVGLPLMGLPAGGALLRATIQTLVAWGGTYTGPKLMLGWSPGGSSEVGLSTTFINQAQTAIQLQMAAIGPFALGREIYATVQTASGAFDSGVSRLVVEFVPHELQSGGPPPLPGG